MPPSLDIEQCYRRYAPMVFRRCKQLLRDDDKAYDALQDTFLKLTRSRERLQPTALAALLNRMATNVAISRLRRERGVGVAGDEDLLLRIACSKDLERSTWASRLLGRLWGEEQDSTRTIAVLHLLDGLTLEETAQEMGLSVSGVRKRLRKLKQLAQHLEVTR